jgi:hypothetical protein
MAATAGLGEPAEAPIFIAVEKSRTRVGFASAHLTLTNLELRDNTLSGLYEVKVPLRRSRGDAGTILLQLTMPVNELKAEGGILRGKSFSTVSPNNQAHLITCTLFPTGDAGDTGTLSLSIQTPERVLKFETTYRVVTGQR